MIIKTVKHLCGNLNPNVKVEDNHLCRKWNVFVADNSQCDFFISQP